MFGFVDKWCGWINGCLNSAMGSVLVNGSPTSEFQFHKGLLSGIPIDSSLTLSHLFFADDAIFVVEATAISMGCLIFTTHFVHIGVKVRGAMSRIKSWFGIFSHSSCLWTRFIKAIYGEDDVLNSPSSLLKRSLWLDIISEEDPWLDDMALNHKFLRLYALDNYKQITVIKKINHASLVDTFRRPRRGGALEEQLGFLLSRMDGLILINILDRWVWSLEATGEFSVKSVRQLIDDSILPKEEVATRKLMRWWDLEDIDLASYDDWLLWLNSSWLSKRLKEILEGVCYVKWWLIWHFRNQLLFGAMNTRRELLFDDLDCGSNKAPGPDGFTFAFVKKYWDLIKMDILEFVNSFFDSCSIPQGANSLFFILILKVSNPIFIKDFRPISLIGISSLVRVSDDEVSNMASSFGCAVGSLPFIYLGLPIGFTMNRISSWKTLIDRFQSRLSSWKASLFSIRGRLTLIKAVLGSLGIYLSIFNALEIILKSLESLRAKLYWGGQDSKKLILIKKANVPSSFEKGGLDIGSLKSFNLALL
ncbi:hypothetical protein Tco_0006057 [Tanacetum coccineum]